MIIIIIIAIKVEHVYSVLLQLLSPRSHNLGMCRILSAVDTKVDLIGADIGRGCILKPRFDMDTPFLNFSVGKF